MGDAKPPANPVLRALWRLWGFLGLVFALAVVLFAAGVLLYGLMLAASSI